MKTTVVIDLMSIEELKREQEFTKRLLKEGELVIIDSFPEGPRRYLGELLK